MDEQEEEITKRVFDILPMIRVYIAASTLTGDQLDIDELRDWISQEGPSIVLKKLIDDGLVNIYLTCFDSVERLF